MPTTTPTATLRTVVKNVLAGTLTAVNFYENGIPMGRGVAKPAVAFTQVAAVSNPVLARQVDGSTKGDYLRYRLQMDIYERSEETRDSTADTIKRHLGGTVAAGSFEANSIIPYPSLIAEFDLYDDESQSYRKVQEYRFHVIQQFDT